MITRGLHAVVHWSFGHRRRLIAVLGFAACFLSWSAPDLLAQQPSSAVGSCATASLHDFDADGQPDSLKVLCDFKASGLFADSITIIDRDGDLFPPLADNWSAAIDDLDDLWVFDYHDDEQPEILIGFSRANDRLTARLYDVSTGFREHNEGDLQSVLSSTTPVIQVTTQDSYWNLAGRLSFNLDLVVDGAITAVFVNPTRLQRLGIAYDGRPDYTITVRDTDQDGAPDLEWRQANFGLLPGARLLSDAPTNLVVNVNDDERPLVPTLLWAHIGSLSTGYLTSNPQNRGTPPIQVNWDTGRIEFIGEYVASRANDNQWFVYTFNSLVPNQTSIPNFEAPFAWYDLAADQDDSPELAVRITYVPPYDPYFRNGLEEQPLISVRYTWDQNNDNFWDYKLGGINREQIDTEVTLPALNLRMTLLPYDIIPGWTVDQPWDVVSFVAADAVDVTGEGIYEGDLPPSLLSYILGDTNAPLLPDEHGMIPWGRLNYPFDDGSAPPVDPGFRAEYSFDHLDMLNLYISAIDRKLHLMNADFSLLAVSAEVEIYAQDLNGDGFLDNWERRDQGVTTERLILTDSYLFHIQSDSVSITRVTQPPALYQTRPPASHAEWAVLGAQLDEYQRAFVPDNLEAMFEQFGSAVWHFAGTVHDIRFTADSLRFVVATDGAALPDARTVSALRLAGIADGTVLAPNRYLIEATSDELMLSPAVPAHITVANNTITADNESLLTLTPVTLHLALQNDGGEDAPQMEVVWHSVHNGEETEIGRSQVDLLAGESASASIVWQPRVSGVSSVTADVYAPDGGQSPLVSAVRTFEVRSAEVSLPELASLQNTLPMGGLFMIIAAFCILVLAALIATAIWRTDPQDQDNEV